MKRLWILILLIQAPALRAEETNLPVSIGKLRGVILDGLTAKHDFAFQPGGFSKCKVTSLTKWTFHKCESSDSKLIVTEGLRGRDSLFVEFNEVSAIRKRLKTSTQERVRFEYHYFGTWENITEQIPLRSKAQLKLYYYEDEPEIIRGSIHLIDYDTQVPLLARRD